MAFSPSRADLGRMFPRPKSARAVAVWSDYIDAMTSPEFARMLDEFEITTPARWHGLCGTWFPETGGLTILWESGAYSAAGILRVFGVGKHSARVTPEEARILAGDGPALFERVYGLGNPGKAKSLGNTQPGDGWRFRGLGPNQLTGRWAHEKSAEDIGCSLDDLCLPINAFRASLLEWQRKGCNRYADRGDWTSIRKLINAGSLKVPAIRLNGLKEAIAASEKAARIWPKLVPQIDLDEGQSDDPSVAEIEPKPLPAAPVTAKDLVGVSRKITLLSRIKRLFAWTGIGGGGAYTFADLTGQGKEFAHVVADFARDNALVVLVVGLAVGFLVAHILEQWCVEDANDARYTPKGSV